MNIKLKVCGMRETVNILEVASLQPDYMGFIFYLLFERTPSLLSPSKSVHKITGPFAFNILPKPVNSVTDIFPMS